MSTTTAKTAWRKRPQEAPQTISEETAELIEGWWRAANYLSVAQIYLLDNPLLRRPLSREDVKRRLLGHWGTTPGLNFLYAHFNRAIVERDLNAIYIAGPGHGGPGLVANAYLDHTLHRGLSGDQPRDEVVWGVCASSSPFPAGSRPCVAGVPRLDPRGRGAGLLVVPRLRFGVQRAHAAHVRGGRGR